MADPTQNFILRIRAIADMKDATKALAALRELARETDDAARQADKQETQNREAAAAAGAKARADLEAAAAAKAAADAAREAAAAEAKRGEAARATTPAVDAAAAATNRQARAGDGAAQSTRNFTKAGEEATRPTRNAAMGVLEVSRAYEDLQYGIRGVLNNIPSMVLAFGGGMGLAGVLSLAAVAGSQLWNALSGDDGEKEKAIAAAEAATESMNKILAKYREMGVERAKLAQDNYLRALESESDEIAHQSEMLRAQIELAREAARLQYELREAQRARERAAIEQRGAMDPAYAAPGGGMQADLARIDRASAADRHGQEMAKFDNRLEDLKRQEMEAQSALLRTAELADEARQRAADAEGRLADVKREQLELEYAATQATRLYTEAKQAEARAAEQRRRAQQTDFVTGAPEFPGAAGAAAAFDEEAAALRARADALAARSGEESRQSLAMRLAEAENAAKLARESQAEAERAMDAGLRETEQMAAGMEQLRAGIEQQRQLVDQTFETVQGTVDMSGRLEELKAREAELRQAIDEAARRASEGGREMSAGFREGMASLDAAMADGYQAMDFGKMITAFNAFRNTNEAGLAGMAQNINLMVAKLQALDAENKRINGVLQQIAP